MFDLMSAAGLLARGRCPRSAFPNAGVGVQWRKWIADDHLQLRGQLRHWAQRARTAFPFHLS